MEDRNFVFSVGCGDAWLSYSSITPIAIATTREKALELIAQHAKDNEIELTSEEDDDDEDEDVVSLLF